MCKSNRITATTANHLSLCTFLYRCNCRSYNNVLLSYFLKFLIVLFAHSMIQCNIILVDWNTEFRKWFEGVWMGCVFVPTVVAGQLENDFNAPDANARTRIIILYNNNKYAYSALIWCRWVTSVRLSAQS